MSRRVFKTPAALADVLEQAQYLAEQTPDAAERFLDALEQTLLSLLERPELGALHVTKNTRLLGLRIWRVGGFANHLIFYRSIQSGIEIVRVLHGARDIESILDAP